jgi:6-pyruvoyltetrahydropterin/6-carboxytetrahydropterin synthase
MVISSKRNFLHIFSPQISRIVFNIALLSLQIDNKKMQQEPVKFNDRSEADRVIQAAKQALRNGLRDQARKLAERSAVLNPKNEDAWLILAAVSSPNASIVYLKTAIRINPSSERARKGMQWALERAQKEEIQNQFLAMVKNTQPLPTKPIQEHSNLLPATPVLEHSQSLSTNPLQEYSHPLPTTLVQEQLPPLSVTPIRDHSSLVSEADFWQIDVAKIITPGKYAFDFILNGFFTAFHQVSITGSGMGEMHPHTYRLQITASAELVTRNNQVIVSYDNIRTVMDRVCTAYEGKTLNDLPLFKNLQPTTENLVGAIAQQLEKLSSGMKYKIYEVTLMESPTVGVVHKNMNIIRSFQ